MSDILLSVIIPVHNNEKCIKGCCNSICAQTYKNLEIIFIDDCSEDKSVSIIKSEMQKDDRIQLIRLDSNQSAFVARKKGVEKSSGDYILFCDADDYISEKLCEELLAIESKLNVDILHFSTEIVDCGVGNAEILRARDFFKMYEGEIINKDIFLKCFIDEFYCYNLWNKLFKKKLCKTVFAIFDDWYIPKANDLFAYFFLSLNAKTYYGVMTEGKYYYSYGKGDTGKKKLDLEGLFLYNSYFKTLSIMTQLCKNKFGINSIIRQAISNLKKRLMTECLTVWSRNLTSNFKRIGFDAIANTWDIETITESFFAIFGIETSKIAEDILGAESLRPITLKSRNIAVYYYRLGRGGVERVISLLIPLYIEMGYRVILITEEKENSNDYQIPAYVKRYTVPKFNLILSGKESYANRAHALRTILEKESIDTLCYHAATAPGLFYDLLVAKRLGIKVILSKHELFSQGMVKNLDLIQKELDVYRLADKVIVLSETERLFWNTMSVDAFYIQNPFNFNIKNNNNEKKCIVWAGRLDPYQKRYQDIIPIMKKVVDIVPNALMKVYGSSETYKDLYNLKHMVAASGLENNIEYCGYTSDVNEIYQDAKIHLVTSSYESFPMNVYESRIFGVPLVIYDMPYLEMLSGGKGYVAVKQRDTDKAAEAIIKLLQKTDYWEKVANEAIESSKQYDNAGVKEKWKAVFENVTQEFQDDREVNREDYAVILKTIAFHSALGCENAQKNNVKLWCLRRDKMAYEIKLKILQENLEVALYPYGNIGRNTKEILEKYDIAVKLAVDKNSKDSELLVVKIEELKDIDCSKYLFVICSNRGDIYDEIRGNIKKYVCENNIYDLYSDYFE